MSPRIKLRAAATPLVLAGALWGTTSLPQALANRPQTPPPCNVDGVCKPNAVWGYYKTNWRTFPGDDAGLQPSKAEGAGQSQQEKAEQELHGPEMPDMAKEGQVGSELPKRATGGAAAPGAEAQGPGEILPGAPTLPAGDAPAAPLNLEAPPADELNPLGAQQPKPDSRVAQPSWLNQSANARLEQLPNVPEKERLQRLPNVPAPSAAYEPIEQHQPADYSAADGLRPPVLDGPNLQSEDAPPALPASLQRISRQGLQANPTWLPGVVNELPPVDQPSSVRPASHNRVTQTSAQSPLGIQNIVRPAGGASPAPTAAATDQGPQQAIYIEDNASPPGTPAGAVKNSDEVLAALTVAERAAVASGLLNHDRPFTRATAPTPANREAYHPPDSSSARSDAVSPTPPSTRPPSR